MSGSPEKLSVERIVRKVRARRIADWPEGSLMIWEDELDALEAALQTREWRDTEAEQIRESANQWRAALAAKDAEIERLRDRLGIGLIGEQTQNVELAALRRVRDAAQRVQMATDDKSRWSAVATRAALTALRTALAESHSGGEK